MSDITLRRARPEGWQAIAALHAASWRSAYRGILDDAFLAGPIEADRAALWSRRLNEPVDPATIVVLAEEEREPVGFACILVGQHPVWGSLIDNLHIRPDRLRRRLGRRLLAEAAREVPPGEAARPLHLTVLEQNSRAIAAYERWGGRLGERLREPLAGGQYPVRRYVWDDRAALLRCLEAAP